MYTLRCSLLTIKFMVYLWQLITASLDSAEYALNLQPGRIGSMSGFLTNLAYRTDDEKAEILSLSSPLLISYRSTTNPVQNNGACFSLRYVGFLQYICVKRPIRRDTWSRVYRHPCKRNRVLSFLWGYYKSSREEAAHIGLQQ